MNAAETVDGDRFLAQNGLCAATLTADDVEIVDNFAEHHSGGLFVLLGEREDGLLVKAHDSWGDDGQVVVHTYDPDDESVEESEAYYATGHEAIAAFVRAVQAAAPVPTTQES